MTRDYQGEEWKTIKFDIEYTNDFRIEISNFGRLRTFNKMSNGNIVNGSMINGYRIIRLKLFTPRDETTKAQFDYLQLQVAKLSNQLKTKIDNKEDKVVIDETKALLQNLKKNVSKKYGDDLKKRTIYYQALVHRLVAEYFLEKPTPDQTIVAHLDFEKLNNRAYNLKWMTPAENYEHQKNSPYVIKDKQQRGLHRKVKSKATKLTVTKVMLLKKLLNEGKPMKQLVRYFKITDTQILRIKKGENWGDVEAAS